MCEKTDNQIYNPNFNYGEAGLMFKISVKEWVQKTNAIGLKATAARYEEELDVNWDNTDKCILK